MAFYWLNIATRLIIVLVLLSSQPPTSICLHCTYCSPTDFQSFDISAGDATAAAEMLNIMLTFRLRDAGVCTAIFLPPIEDVVPD